MRSGRTTGLCTRPCLEGAVDQYRPQVFVVVKSGQIRPRSGELPEKARFVAKPFSAEMLKGFLHEILPDKHKPAPLGGTAGSPQAQDPLRGSGGCDP